MGDWIQDHWFELGSLLAQLGILATLAWFGRKALAILDASPRSAEAARPRVAEAAPVIDRVGERVWEPVGEPEGEFHGGLRGLIPMDGEAYRPAARSVVAVTAGVDPWHAFVTWLNTPWKGGNSVAWRRVSRQVS